jgi:glutamate-ammonia-ligase adenylyltransferase
MKQEMAAKLVDCYIFLRRVEHRIQFLDDQQTHCLPGQDSDLAWIARSLGMSCHVDACELLDRLCEVREIVATEFDSLLHDGQAPAGNGCRSCGGPALTVDTEEFLASLPPELATAVRRLAGQQRVQALRDESRLRLAKLIGRAADGRGFAFCRLDRAAAAARKLSGPAGRTSGSADPLAAPAGAGALADALFDAAPRRHR